MHMKKWLRPSDIDQPNQPIHKVLFYAVDILLLITLICVFVPFAPAMPAEGLDPSWRFGINQAVSQGLVFGRDLIFTFGPYASIYTKTYHPATDFLMLAGTFYLAISYWVAFFFLAKGSRRSLIVTFLVVLAGLMFSPDALLFSYPLLVGLTCFKLICVERKIARQEKGIFALIIFLFLPFGLLPLTKISLLMLCVAVTGLVFVLFVGHKKWLCATAVALSPIFSVLFFWMLSGQSIFDLSTFFISAIPIISGYTEAMATNGLYAEVIFYFIAASFLLITVLREKNIPIFSKWILFCIFFVFLFVAFKGGFVRQHGHAFMSGLAVLIAALFASLLLKSRQRYFVLLLSIFVCLYISGHYVNTSIVGIYKNIQSTYSSAWYGFQNRLSLTDWPKSEFDNAVLSLQKEANFPVFPGTTDIYSYNQSYLIASKNGWNPRPIFQSYSAYTPILAEKNKAHLLGKNAPDNVIFKVEPLDGKIPSLEDGASWPSLLMRYEPSALENGFLYLHKRPDKGHVSEELVPIGSGTYTLGEEVIVPPSTMPLFTEISIEQNIFGKLLDFLYKPSQLRISMHLENGDSRTYRIVANMAKSGFVLSPLIDSTAEFGFLYAKKGALDGKRVRSFSIFPAAVKKLWKPRYTVVFKQIEISPIPDISEMYTLDAVLNASEEMVSAPIKKCDANIDSVNGVLPVPEKFFSSGLLSAQGWLVRSADQGTLAESVFLVLQDSKGKNIFIKTRSMQRPDVGAHFHKPALAASGYVSTADVSTLEGNYTLGLAFKEGNHIWICPEFHIPGVIKKIVY